ncbi:MAG TPA: DUF4364 family protein [Oscillospiraceae bacterium]|jgi:hypothetical protein|nr:hypothetical protein [Oscillospiraceae bacterium]MDN5378270.1 hypothetical protein [Clostridiales bacterium]HOV41774.1 DUF4364 family protein [Oscillospiraceae bacterium]
MDSISKVSADYSLELKDLHTVKILLCYLLKKLDRPVTPEQLYEIAVGNEIINYFFYTEAVDELVKNKTFLKEIHNGEEVFVLAEKGKYSIDEFRQYVPKSFRDKLLTCALRYFAKLKRENEVKCEFIELEKGYYVRCRILDIGDDLLDMKIFAPDLEQAKLIRDKIMLNPTDFYSKIMGFALFNTEEEIMVDD